MLNYGGHRTTTEFIVNLINTNKNHEFIFLCLVFLHTKFDAYFCFLLRNFFSVVCFFFLLNYYFYLLLNFFLNTLFIHLCIHDRSQVVGHPLVAAR